MSILVIGGTGTLGRQIVRLALNEVYQVKCLVRDFRRSAFLKDWGAELVYGDLSLPSTLPMALKDVKIIIDSATIRSTSNYTLEIIDWRGKKALLEAIVDGFAPQRERFNHLMANRSEIDAALEIGAQKARKIAREVLDRTRSKAGY